MCRGRKGEGVEPEQLFPYSLFSFYSKPHNLTFYQGYNILLDLLLNIKPANPRVVKSEPGILMASEAMGFELDLLNRSGQVNLPLDKPADLPVAYPGNG